ncbi:hypothetical protein CLAFUW4_02437 [Fulvia fulva]|nr:hypothetical protein CLAFUR4_02432 [Fulvia fulva]KAK4633210.1 hypothetical protein CLAFUR0_02436 [Fulvia fulva]WPV10758.1 hypothetical protein CLAFUW4_02437 [Fulvia fulva]WPV25683.1 hypothetical protein CLAFUW7_02437 [Fulvia fulva]
MAQHGQSFEAEFTLEVEGLFGDGSGSQTIVGSVSALTALQEAFASGLIISAGVSSGSAAFDASCIYLQDISAMPDFRQESVLNDLSDKSTRAVKKLDEIAGQGNPPFQAQYLNSDGIPRLLRCLSKYHCERYYGKFNYQLGVLTVLGEGSMNAQVFASTLQKVVTHTVWISRRIAPPVNVGEQYSEVFSAFVLPDVVAVPNPQYTRRDEIRTTNRTGSDDATTGQQPVISKAKQADIAERQTPKSRGSSASAWQNKWLYDQRSVNVDNFSDGRLHPDDIQGEMVMLLVPHISTADLQARINELYEKINGSGRQGNFATLRFRNALIAKCEREGLDRQTEWIEVQNQRRQNGVKADTGRPPSLHLGINKGNAYAKRKVPVAKNDTNEDESGEEDQEEDLEEDQAEEGLQGEAEAEAEADPEKLSEEMGE